jgi:hypothetical protein
LRDAGLPSEKTCPLDTTFPVITDGEATEELIMYGQRLANLDSCGRLTVGPNAAATALAALSELAAMDSASTLTIQVTIPRIEPEDCVAFDPVLDRPRLEPARLRGAFREKTDSDVFVDRIRIRSVSDDGGVVGRLSIAGIVRNAELTGTIDERGRVTLRFEGQSDWAGAVVGSFIGKVKRDCKRLRGNLTWAYGDVRNGASTTTRMTFQRSKRRG